MDTDAHWLIPLREAADCEAERVGGKARQLARLARAGFRTPEGFCIPTSAYRAFVARNHLTQTIQMELGRKPLDAMRWEELWDAALRIRSAFLAGELPDELVERITRTVEAGGPDRRWAVRSSAPGEDGAESSFAGLFESRIDLADAPAVLAAVRVVWASLWSDAALLYRRELALDPAQSAMAVLVQRMISADRSGVAFARDPLRPERATALVEAVPGPCSDLVDGRVDPDRFTLARPTGELVEWRPGVREPGQKAVPLLESEDLATLMKALLEVEALFGWPPDLEWTDRARELALLQARPISSLAKAPDEARAWYLSLRPGSSQLAALCDRVEHERMPELVRAIDSLAASDLERCNDEALADEIATRHQALQRWLHVYRDEFIPLAHGVRQLGSYYDEAVRPRDPYEFVGLLASAPLAALARNRRIAALAESVRASPALRRAVEAAVQQPDELDRIAELPGGRAWLDDCRALLSGLLDVTFAGERLSDRADLLLQIVLALADGAGASPADRREETARMLEKKLLDAVGADRHDEARQVLRIGRVSWRLRDDDNLLLGRIESQLLRALRLGLERLHAAGRLERPVAPRTELAPLVADALRTPSNEPVAIPETAAPAPSPAPSNGAVRPRQLIGQPASPGFATGRARRVTGAEDLGRFRAGEVLVCDAIQPTMTQLVPLASAIVERRGGMLIHGAIIARELGIPCVNGVASAIDSVADGERLCVDGDFGLVTIGDADFDVEARAVRD